MTGWLCPPPPQESDEDKSDYNLVVDEVRCWGWARKGDGREGGREFLSVSGKVRQGTHGQTVWRSQKPVTAQVGTLRPTEEVGHSFPGFQAPQK